MNIYVISGSEWGPSKIGMAIDPNRRLRELQTANPTRLSIFHSQTIGTLAEDVERMAHDLLRAKRSPAGNEWFDVSPAGAVLVVKIAASSFCNLVDYREKSLSDAQLEVTLKWLEQKNDYEEARDFEEEFPGGCPDLLRMTARSIRPPSVGNFTFNDYVLTWNEGMWLRWALERMGKEMPRGKTIDLYLKADDYLEDQNSKLGRNVALRWLEWSKARVLDGHEVAELVHVWNKYARAYNTVFEAGCDAGGRSNHIDNVYVYALRGDRGRGDWDKIVFYHKDFRAVLVPERHVELVDYKKSIFGRLNCLPDIGLRGFVAPPTPTDIWERPLQSWLSDAGRRQANSFRCFMNNDAKRYPEIERHEKTQPAAIAWRDLDRVDEYGLF